MSSSPANASRNPSVALSRNGSTTGGSTLGSPNPRRPKDGSPKFQRKTPTLASQLVAKVRAGDLLLPKCNELEKRMIKGEEERVARDAAGEDDVEVQDPIEMTMQDMLCMAASDREAQHRDSIATFIELNAPAWASQFTDERIKAVAASCLYHFFQPGSTVCEAEEDTAFYFIVLTGTVQIEEPQVHHKEGVKATDSTNFRTRTCDPGHGFQDFPLVMGSKLYGYNARVDDPAGASIMLIPKELYTKELRTRVKNDMDDTVALLKSTPFFTMWSEQSVARLYFWFEKKKLAPEEDVVKQGDDADFCFIIKSGRCDVLVELTDEEKAELGIEEGTPEGATPVGERNASVHRGNSTHGGSMHGGSTHGGSRCSDRNPSVMTERSHPSPSPGRQPSSVKSNRDASPGSVSFSATGDSPSTKKKKEKERKNSLLTGAAAAFLNTDADGPPLRVGMRHVVTLKPGAIVGEIALFQEGVVRMATVRASEQSEVLILDKKSFLELDRQTLNSIAENARYNAACTKEPSQRGREDLQILQQRTMHLSHMSKLSTEVQTELCRVMRYRKVNEGVILVRRHSKATCFYIIISGTINTYSSDPKMRASKWGAAVTKAAGGALGGLLKKGPDAGQYLQMKPTDQLIAGHAFGEAELLEAEPIFHVTAVTSEATELMEIDRRDFDRILKADKNSEKGRLIDFLNGLSMMSGMSVAAIHALSNVATKKSFTQNAYCLAHPPAPKLGVASYSYDHVYLIYSGECRLIGGHDPDANPGAAPAAIEPGSPAFGPLIGRVVPPSAAKVEQHMGLTRVPLATLGPGEVVFDNMLPGPSSRWVLRAITPIEFLCIPRKEWVDTLRSSVIAEMRELAAVKAHFFSEHMEANVPHVININHLQKPKFSISSPNRRSSGFLGDPSSPRSASPPRRLQALDPSLIQGSPTRSADGGSPRKGSPQRSTGQLPPIDSPTSPTKRKDSKEYEKAGMRILCRPSGIGSRPLSMS